MIDPRSGVPLHRQLADELRRVVAEMQPGALLPTEAALGHEYGLGRATVRRAIAALRAEGLVEVPRGQRARVREQVEREDVHVQRGSRVRGRMPTPEERTEFDLDEGVPVFEIHYGGRVRVVPCDQYDLTTS